jgi:hypothetical protein
MGDSRVASPILYEGRRRLAVRHVIRRKAKGRSPRRWPCRISDPKIEAGATSMCKVVKGLLEVCPPHRRHSWSHHLSPQALDIDWNPIRKYKKAGAP